MEAAQKLENVLEFPAMTDSLQFEELESMVTPGDSDWVLGFTAGASFATGFAIGVAIAT
jgi:hypothetical protein